MEQHSKINFVFENRACRRMVLRNRLAYLIIEEVQFGPDLDSTTVNNAEIEALGAAAFLGDRPVYIKEMTTGMTRKRITHNLPFVNALVAVSTHSVLTIATKNVVFLCS